MVVRIRLARFGCNNKPFYRVKAADSRFPRDRQAPRGQDGGKRMGLNFERVKYWLSVGAQPSEPVQRLLFRAGLLPPPPMVAMGRKGGLRDTRPVDPLYGRILTPKVLADPDQENKSKSYENDGRDKLSYLCDLYPYHQDSHFDHLAVAYMLLRTCMSYILARSRPKFLRVANSVLLVKWTGLSPDQNKIQSLAGQHSDILESLSPHVRKRVEVLRDIQVGSGRPGFAGSGSILTPLISTPVDLPKRYATTNPFSEMTHRFPKQEQKPRVIVPARAN
ncbi:37S ribosomal protein S16 [Morus notabilis]|uniref:37S ribosomal protein S16 n=1 Tax=Morus notabilis TaxID=981085 RepID=W9R615_9ROSA|nr:37S ribosomal protein S16 [Morus notabilis]